MATAAATPIKPRREMQEVKAPEQFQFSKQGQTVQGVLVSIEPVEIKGKVTKEYEFVRENGERFTCLDTADLGKKIHPGHIGHYMEIRYETDDSSFQKQGQSPMKVFKVLVDKEKSPGF